MIKRLIRKFTPYFIFDWYHFLLSFLGAIIYNFPSRKLIVIGVTGTNGKSTVVHLITEILESVGHKTASLSSIRFKIGDKEQKNMLKMTMPGRFKLQKFLRQAVKTGCKYAVLEITSEGIKQYRHKFIDFDGAVFTNLTKEHIETHKGFENYKKAKGKLFKALAKSRKRDKFAVINLDDENADYFLGLVGDIKKYTYGIYNKQAEITPKKINLQINLPGEFNIYNSLAAFCAGIALGIDKNKILEVLKTAKGVPGRMELVIEKPFKVFVDYAHTPDSLAKVYQTIRKLQISSTKSQTNSKSQIQNPKLICVLGSCGGGRDRWKRPEMGKIAGEYCDKIILTNEDPYSENPLSILNDIEKGFSQKPNAKIQIPNYEKILDRREAINKALFLAKNNDTVIITGKGCEPWICVAGGRKVVWDDRRVVGEEFEKLRSKNPKNQAPNNKQYPNTKL